MKERFKSILLELKTSLLNPNVKKELKNDEDKEQHEKLLEFVDIYVLFLIFILKIILQKFKNFHHLFLKDLLKSILKSLI